MAMSLNISPARLHLPEKPSRLTLFLVFRNLGDSGRGGGGGMRFIVIYMHGISHVKSHIHDEVLPDAS